MTGENLSGWMSGFKTIVFHWKSGVRIAALKFPDRAAAAASALAWEYTGGYCAIVEPFH